MKKLITAAFIILIIYLGKEVSDALARIEESVKSPANVSRDSEAEKSFREFKKNYKNHYEEEEYWDDDHDEDFHRRANTVQTAFFNKTILHKPC